MRKTLEILIPFFIVVFLVASGWGFIQLIGATGSIFIQLIIAFIVCGLCYGAVKLSDFYNANSQSSGSKK